MRGTPQADRLHIGIFGRRNAGKSSLINALTGQSTALVSAVPGTTTDPVSKTMEILPIGPVVIVDTAGVDDAGDLGSLRVERTRRVLRQTDVAVAVLDPTSPPGEVEEGLLAELQAAAVPVVVVLNKVDLFGGEVDLFGREAALSGREAALSGGEVALSGRQVALSGRQVALSETGAAAWARRKGLEAIPVSSLTGQGIGRLKQALVAVAPQGWEGPRIIGDLLEPGDTVLLVVPVDLEAPKGRLILPQVQALRDILDHEATALVTKESQLAQALEALAPLTPSRPRLVVTDSQAFDLVARLTPPEVALTSFSILFARHKGDLATLVRGAAAIDRLHPGDHILVAEACTHHPIGDDIGRLKIPRWLEKRAGGPLAFTHAVGGDFAQDLSGFKLIVHCGGCMINRREMLYRLSVAGEAGVPIVNYGVAIAHLHGILSRALAPFAISLTPFSGPCYYNAPGSDVARHVP